MPDRPGIAGAIRGHGRRDKTWSVKTTRETNLNWNDAGTRYMFRNVGFCTTMERGEYFVLSQLNPINGSLKPIQTPPEIKGKTYFQPVHC